MSPYYLPSHFTLLQLLSLEVSTDNSATPCHLEAVPQTHDVTTIMRDRTIYPDSDWLFYFISVLWLVETKFHTYHVYQYCDWLRQNSTPIAFSSGRGPTGLAQLIQQALYLKWSDIICNSHKDDQTSCQDHNYPVSFTWSDTNYLSSLSSQHFWNYSENRCPVYNSFYAKLRKPAQITNKYNNIWCNL